MDDDDRIDGHAQLVALADAGIDRRETQDGRREDRARRPGAGRRDLLRDASAVVIRIGEVGRGAQTCGHAVTALDGKSLGGAATADERRVEGDAEASLGLEGRADRAVGEIVAVEVVRGCAAAAEEIIEDGVDRGDVEVALGRAGTARRQAAITAGIGERFDAADDEGIGVTGRSLAAQGSGRAGGGFGLPLIHTVEVAVEIPGRAADDASGPVVGMRGRVAGSAEQADVRVRQRVVLQQRTLAGGGGQADQVGGESIGVEELGCQRDFVGEAEAFRGLAAVAVLDEVDRRPDRGDRAEVARGPLGGARRGP